MFYKNSINLLKHLLSHWSSLKLRWNLKYPWINHKQKLTVALELFSSCGWQFQQMITMSMYGFLLLLLLLVFFRPCLVACRILVPSLGTEPMPSAVEGWSLNPELPRKSQIWFLYMVHWNSVIFRVSQASGNINFTFFFSQNKKLDM